MSEQRFSGDWCTGDGQAVALRRTTLLTTTARDTAMHQSLELGAGGHR